jgi:O-antigen/teichoic acid export membrane protein
MQLSQMLRRFVNSNAIVTESTIALSLKLIGLGLGYFVNILISRELGAEGVGHYQLMVQTVLIFSSISLLGTDVSVIRVGGELLGNSSEKEMKLLVGANTLLVFAVSIITSLVLVFASEFLALHILKSAQLTYVFKITGFIVPLFVVLKYWVEVVRLYEKIIWSEFLRQISTRLLLVVVISSFLLIDRFELTGLSIHLTYLLGTGVSVLIGWVILYGQIKVNFTKLVDTLRKFDHLKISLTVYQSVLLNLVATKVLIYILAYFTSPKEVGIFRIVDLITSTTSFAFVAVMTAVGPRLSKSFWSNRDDLFDQQLRYTTKLTFCVCIRRD